MPAAAGFSLGVVMDWFKDRWTDPDAVRKGSEILFVGGSGGGILSGLTLNDWGVIIGIAVAVIGGAFGALLKWREHQLNMKKIAAELNELAERQAFRRKAEENQLAYFLASPELKALDVGEVEHVYE